MTDELRELDEVCARVMGWHKEEFFGQMWWAESQATRTYESAGVVMTKHWHPTTSIEQAYQVLQAVKEKPFSFKLRVSQALVQQANDENWETHEDKDVLWWFLFGAKWPETICRAIKGAVGEGND